ncbi:hypothetical protein BC940DRAFT_291120 [Gongronella butleri]|nr:hypothetical protein BC940DRAFT_291120 [Gongronella butleri]
MWLPLKPLDSYSDRTKLTLTAVAASSLTALSLLSWQAARRQQRAKKLKRDLVHGDLAASLPLSSSSQQLNALGLVGSPSPTTKKAATGVRPHDPTLIEEQLARNQAFLGSDGLVQVRQAHVVVVGTGSVGSWAALMLARSGVQQLRVIDPARLQQQDVASHAAATPRTIGMAKVHALQAIIAPIVPFVHVDAIHSEWQPRHIMDVVMEISKTTETTPSSSSSASSTNDNTSANSRIMVIDCLGHTSLDAKVKLIQFCRSCDIPIISALDPGNKVDPTRIQLTDISDTFDDPSAKLLRRRLKLLGIDRHLPVAYSTEKPTNPKYVTHGDEVHHFDDQSRALPDVRSRHTPIVGAIAAMYGMTLTTYTLLHLADFSAYQAPPIRQKDKQCTRIYDDLRKREKQVYGTTEAPLTHQEIAYIYEELWHGKSAVSGPRDRLTLVRWDRTKPLSLTNAVCMSKDEARAHDELPADTDLHAHYDQDVVAFIEKQFQDQHNFDAIWN